ncbi:hypothetical protein BEL04_20520 [Mucilaginibacter sp. PPCGB 2223]|uniref:hypothetical protein n=1 Tax=Mucilaginibacter sp. PPCGB 2223 TaxID=1886027 RepID=UPI00082598B4|nr:hypothetical protein [Mucilaginibacter sp. PPCGB 2223]OCX51101.1 hypothetical protein BEL04_20520 [Mucilaginibacter sp. PPCGB 2223]
MNNIALIVHACDRYQLLYRGFEYFFKRNWPFDEIGIKYYFLTEETDYPSDLFTNIKTGKGEWSDRLLNGLNQIPEEFVIYFQEDMWLSRPVSAETINKVISLALDKDINLFKLSSNDVYQTTSTGNYIDGLSVSVLNNEESKFLMSHQVSVWKKSFLAEQLKYKEHPWRNEREGTKRLRALNPKIYHIDLFSENGQFPINNNGKYLKPSRYYTVSQNAQLNSSARPFIEGLKQADDEATRQYGLVLEYNFEHGITHDGQPKPRKQDIFKKIKNAFKSLFKSSS